MIGGWSPPPGRVPTAGPEGEDAGNPRRGWGHRLVPIPDRVSGVPKPDGLYRVYRDERLQALAHGLFRHHGLSARAEAAGSAGG